MAVSSRLKQIGMEPLKPSTRADERGEFTPQPRIILGCGLYPRLVQISSFLLRCIGTTTRGLPAYLGRMECPT